MILTDYYESLIGKKITLYFTNIKDFNPYQLQKGDIRGRIIDITPCGQFVVKWYSKGHPNYTVDPQNDKFRIHTNATIPIRKKKV